MKEWLALPLLAATAWGQNLPVEPAKAFIQPRFLWADGVWKADNQNEATEMTTAHIECYKHGGKDVVNSEGYCADMTATVYGGVPDLVVNYYPVITWDTERIIAADSANAAYPICVWTQITISLRDYTVMATETRKQGKGHEGITNACKDEPLAQTYHLVNKGEELFNRRLRKFPNAETR
jgi:hypothetical protein